jgi:hypothetical protein
MLNKAEQTIIAATIGVFVLLAIRIIFSKKFWVLVAHHVVDGIAKKVSKIIISCIVFVLAVLLIAIMNY